MDIHPVVPSSLMETGQVKYIEAAVCENGEEFRLVHVAMSEWHRCCNSTLSSTALSLDCGEREASLLPMLPCK